MEYFEIFVTFVGVLMSLGHFLQFFRVYARKSAGDLSLVMYSLFAGGHVIWLVYAILIRSIPLIFSNVISLIGVLSVLNLSVYYIYVKKRVITEVPVTADIPVVGEI